MSRFDGIVSSMVRSVFVTLILTALACGPTSPERPAPATPLAESVTPSAGHAASADTVVAPGAPTQPTPDAPASAANVISGDESITITPLQHASFYLEAGSLVVYIDPTSAASKQRAGLPKADVILVTDIHGDHLDAGEIERLRKPETKIVAPQAVVAKLPGATALANGAHLDIAGVGIDAVPMYNVKRKSDSGELFHTKGRGNGYVLTIAGKRIYVSGDTECIPEMRALTSIDVAFVCMNLPYTMPAEEAAECVRAFRPAVVFPYHHRGQDLEQFSSKVAGVEGTEVRVLDWYPS